MHTHDSNSDGTKEEEEDAPTQKKNSMEARVKNTSKRCMAQTVLVALDKMQTRVKESKWNMSSNASDVCDPSRTAAILVCTGQGLAA